MHDDDAMTDEENSREYLRGHPATEMALWRDWVQTVCGWKKIEMPNAAEWSALSAKWYHGKAPADSAEELVSMRRETREKTPQDS